MKAYKRSQGFRFNPSHMSLMRQLERMHVGDSVLTGDVSEFDIRCVKTRTCDRLYRVWHGDDVVYRSASIQNIYTWIDARRTKKHGVVKM